MSLPIENLNQLGDRFSELAWPMLWQSSLLIATLFAFDFLLRRRIRASVRYALWLIVLVKLVLPPTLALPTSPAWWLQRDSIAVQISPKFKNYTVSYDSTPLLSLPMNALTVPTPPAPVLALTAYLLIIFVIISFGLLAYLLMRWWQITQQVRCAETSERLGMLVNEAQKIIGLKSIVPVKLTVKAMSPAVCGLFRPAILIPRTLVGNFSDEQLRAVLLHELIHLRRGDVWLNFLQSLLQIIYWWHPLVWLANARIRRVREEAVDDAVMLALAGEAETYAPTLLEVAKLALNRPLASLGLVGILESRSALRQRIERLVDFRPPRRAGLTLVSLLGILAFTAIAVPMGNPPVPAENQTASVPLPAARMLDVAGQNTRPPEIFFKAYLYAMTAADFEKVVSGLKFNPVGQRENSWLAASPEQFSRLTENLKLAGLRMVNKAGFETDGSGPATFCIGNGTSGLAQFCAGDGTSGVELDCQPRVTHGLIDLTIQNRNIGTFSDPLAANLFSDNITLENHSGLLFHLNNATGSNIVVIIGIEMISDVPTTNASGIITDTNIQKTLEALQRRTGVEMTNEPKAVITSGRRQSVTAENSVDPSTLAAMQDKLANELADQNNPDAADTVSNRVVKTFRINYRKDYASLKKLFLDASVNIPPTVIVYNDNNSGLLLASGTKEQLSIVYRVVMKLNDVSPSDSDANVRQFLAEQAETVAASFDAKNLFVRTFKIGTHNDFLGQLKKQTSLPVDNAKDIAVAARALFTEIGVDMELPKGKAVFYNDRNGLLLVRATEADLDLIERVIETLTQVAPQVHIKARFIEVPQGAFDGLSKMFVITNRANTTNLSAEVTGILSAGDFQIVLQTLQTRSDAIMLAEPEMVTTSGRQSQIRSTQVITVVTNLDFQQKGDSAIAPQTAQVEIGPMMEMIPYVLPDGYTINLTAIASLAEFLGYDEADSSKPVYDSSGKQVGIAILPDFQTQQSMAELNLWDGQTLVMERTVPKFMTSSDVPVIGDIPLVGHLFQNQRSKTKPKMELLVFVTATIVDPAGNRVHTDADMPFAKDAIPPQPTK